jgi:chemotaxis protein methyltransferase CheR
MQLAPPTPVPSALAVDYSLVSMDTRDFKLFRELIHRHTGIWLRDGKQIMLASRLARRLRHHQLADFADYYQLVETIQDSGAEMRELINCVTTNKTSFFRESHHFDFLRETVVPQAKRSASPGAPKRMRVWSAACSTGEEPFSIAISLMEALGRSGPNSSASAALSSMPQGLPNAPTNLGGWEIEVLASDIDTEVLATASRAVYPEESIEDIPPPMQSNYFLRGKGEMQGRVRVKKEVVSRVQFKRINLMDPVWPVEGLYDAIFFRNALIYFNQDTQAVFLRKMLSSLKPNGYLFLGHSEHVPWLHDQVAPLSHTVYQLRPKGR